MLPHRRELAAAPDGLPVRDIERAVGAAGDQHQPEESGGALLDHDGVGEGLHGFEVLILRGRQHGRHLGKDVLGLGMGLAQCSAMRAGHRVDHQQAVTGGSVRLVSIWIWSAAEH